MDQVDRSTEALAQRRQHVMVGLAGLLACIFFVLDLHLPLGWPTRCCTVSWYCSLPPVSIAGCPS